MYPKISVITPSYNQAEFLEETILSVIGQLYPNLEYIIIDGGSKDSSVEIIKKYEGQIYYWVSETDNGQAEAINKGFLRATGEIVCWLNSDDMFTPGTLFQVAEYFNGKQHPLFLFGNAFTFKENQGNGSASNVQPAHFNYDLKKYDYIIQPSAFWSKTVFDKVGLLNEKLHFMLDWEWFIRVFDSDVEIKQVNDYFSLYRVHEDHKTSSGSDKRVQEIHQLLKRFNPENYLVFADKLYKERESILKWNRKFGYPPTNFLNAIILKLLHPSIFFSPYKQYAFRLMEMF